MRHYIIWQSSKGGKEILTITDSIELARYYRDETNKWYKENDRKLRAYITYCDEGKTYFHKEMKED